ncbi:hypothetical protein ES708_27772 [subsurface metagenome]
MIIIAPKKNRVNVYGKPFHLTPSGKIYPLGDKQNWFTNCMSDGLKGQMNTGKGLSEAKLQANKDKFSAVKEACLLARKGTPRPRGRPKA